MSYLTEPPRENPSAYFVMDRDNSEEMTRLAVQDAMLTTGMGGVLPEQPDPTSLRRVLDVGCGTGGWLRETAKTYPTTELLFGGDISSKMLSYARDKAEAQHLSERVQFKPMDALRTLEFSTSSFDLVNQRFGVSWLRTWEWTKLLVEYQRVTRPGGIIRITEPAIVESNSPALTHLCTIALETFYYSGRFFTQKSDGIIHKLVPMMTQHGIEGIQTRDYVLVYRAGTMEHVSFFEDAKYFYHVALPFFQKWTRVPNDYQEIYRQALKEMKDPHFLATWHLRTVWGIRARDGKQLLMRGLP